MKPKRPKTGLLILIVAIGFGAVGYMLGRADGGGAQSARPGRQPTRTVVEARDRADRAVQSWQAPDAPPELDPSTEAFEDGETPAPSELLASLRRFAKTDRSQMILLGMVADAARIGSPMVPEIRKILDSGVDIRFPSYNGKGLGYPSLRVALLAAAEATGDPEAQAMIAEVARTTESPVEVVFSAHMLDRLDALDPHTAQRTLDSLAGNLTKEQRKAMGSVVRRVVPAAAKANPDYAENFLVTQLRITEGPRASLGDVTAALDGLPGKRARNLVRDTMTAADVPERAKRTLAGRAAQRELPMLTELRQAIESNTVEPRVAASIAGGAMGGKRFGVMNKQARIALKKGDVGKAREIASAFGARLTEAQRTLGAARNVGAQVSPKLDTVGRLHRQTLDQLRASIRRELDRKSKKTRTAKKR